MIAGALWISQTNIKNKNKLQFIKHSWTNGRLPHQNISFQFENEIHQIKYSYINKESISILEKNVEIISFDNEMLECVIDDIRSQYQIYRDEDRLFVFDSFNDIQLKFYRDSLIQILHPLKVVCWLRCQAKFQRFL